MASSLPQATRAARHSKTSIAAGHALANPAWTGLMPRIFRFGEWGVNLGSGFPIAGGVITGSVPNWVVKSPEGRGFGFPLSRE